MHDILGNEVNAGDFVIVNHKHYSKFIVAKIKNVTKTGINAYTVPLKNVAHPGSSCSFYKQDQFIKVIPTDDGIFASIDVIHNMTLLNELYS